MKLWDLIPADWQAALQPFMQWASFQQLESNWIQEKTCFSGAIFPAEPQLFHALHRTPFHQVKAILLGQDPYHEPGQAMGLAFSVPAECKVPPSLRNLLREYVSDLGYPAPTVPSLVPWADAGVLLWNTVLSVREHQPRSHRKLGWGCLTDAVLQALNQTSSPIVFLLLGNDAAAYEPHISAKRHIIIKAAHPSPLSAHHGFFGSRPFSRANQALAEKGAGPIDWRLP